jgi:hypothetical protein
VARAALRIDRGSRDFLVGDLPQIAFAPKFPLVQNAEAAAPIILLTTGKKFTATKSTRKLSEEPKKTIPYASNMQPGERLTDDDWKVVEGKRDQLVGKIQERYGIDREEAERQVSEFERNRGDRASWSRGGTAALRGPAATDPDNPARYGPARRRAQRQWSCACQQRRLPGREAETVSRAQI